MDKRKVTRQIGLVANHPFMGLYILPLLGDFVGQGKITVEYLGQRDLITKEKQNELMGGFNRLHKTGSRKLAKALVEELKSVQY